MTGLVLIALFVVLVAFAIVIHHDNHKHGWHA